MPDLSFWDFMAFISFFLQVAGLVAGICILRKSRYVWAWALLLSPLIIILIRRILIVYYVFTQQHYHITQAFTEFFSLFIASSVVVTLYSLHWFIQKNNKQLIELEKLNLTLEDRVEQRTQDFKVSETKYRRLFQSARDGILILDFNTGKILDVNPFLIDMLGYSHDEFLEKHIWEVSPFKDTSLNKEAFAEIQNLGYVRYEHLPLETKSGRIKEVEFVSNSYPVNGNLFIQCNIRDITERRIAEELLNMRFDLLKFAVDNTLPDLLVRTIDEVCELTHSPIGFYHFIEEDEKTISLQAWSTRTTQEFCTASGVEMHYPVELAGVWADAVKERKAVLHNDYSSLPHRQGLPPGHASLVRELVVPIIRDDKIVAILGIGNKAFDYEEQDVGIVTYLADVAWEITRRKKLEEELQSTLVRYLSLFEGTRSAVVVYRTEDGESFKIIAMNRAAEKVDKVSRIETIGKDVMDAFPGVKEFGLLSVFRRVWKTGRSEVHPLTFYKNGSTSGWRENFVYKLPSGEIVAIYSDESERTILQCQQKLIISILGLLNKPYTGIQTISDLLKIIQEYVEVDAIALRLQKGEEFPYFVYSGFDDSFIQTEGPLCSRDSNRCIIRDEIGRPLLECMCGCVLSGKTSPEFPFFTQGGSFWTNSTTDIRIDPGVVEGKLRNQCNINGYESVAIVPLTTDSAMDEIVGTLQLNSHDRDKFTVPMIRFLEELALVIGIAIKRSWQEDRIYDLEIAKSNDQLEHARALNAGIAHELKTPMQAITNILEFVNSGIKEIGKEHDGRDVQNNCREMLDLMQDAQGRMRYATKVLTSLSAYAKAGSSKSKHLINVVSEVETVVKTLRYTESFKGLTEAQFKVEGPEEPCTIEINESDFMQVITNLCKNAREAIDHEDPRIVLRITKHRDMVEIFVVDNGHGIKSIDEDAIFKPYYSTKSSNSQHNQGLGLAIVKTIVLSYGGHISYTSVPGHTEFCVKFPCKN
jgi:PAS domain S-box-containing protein